MKNRPTACTIQMSFSLSFDRLAEMLGVSEETIYELWNDDELEGELSYSISQLLQTLADDCIGPTVSVGRGYF